jgi:hypothetical protein
MQKQQPQQWFGPEKSEGRMAKPISEKETRSIIASMMGIGDDQSVIGGPNPGTWKGVLVVGGAIVLVGILLVNLGKRLNR